MNTSVSKILIPAGASIRDAIRAIDAGSLGIALVVEDGALLRGTVTDGDVRRAILRGVDLDSPVSAIMHREPHTARPGTDMQELRRILIESSLEHLPVVDESGRVVDMYTVSQLLAVPLSNPDITDKEIDAVLSVLKTPNLSLGPKLLEFERKVAALAERKYAVAVNSGTSGLHLVVRALGLGVGDEVVTTPFSFIASSNCLLYEGVRPVFVDIEPETYNIDPSRITAAITPRTKAILAVDVFGQPARYKDIAEIAQAHGLKVISDCCESIGAEYRGRKASVNGVAGVFAFYPNKQVTTGEGGVIVTDDSEIARLCRSMRNQGRGDGDGWLAHERLGYNYRLSEISCALGIVQVERIDDILEKRQRVADEYSGLLAEVNGVHMPYVDEETTRMSWFVYVVRLAERYDRTDRDWVLKYLRRHGIGANNYFPPIHLQPLYREQFGSKEGDYPIAESVGSRSIALPFHNNLTREECSMVVKHLKSALAELPRSQH